MPPLFLLCALCATAALAAPNGFYHQEYNYRTSSSSYKNHELQHRNDDEGFYSKAGDLEGRFRPRVDAHSQHSEYVNPKLQHAYRIGTDRTSSFGQLHAQSRLQPGEPLEGAPFAYMRPQGGAGPDLRQVTAALQRELEQELQRAVFDHHQREAAYGGGGGAAQAEAVRTLLQEELRRNMTMRLQEALKAHYGNQGVRGAYSYSIVGGRLQPTANYHNQELEDLTRQMEAELMRHLDQQVQTQYHTRVDTQVHTQRNTYRVNGVNGDYPSPLQQRPVYHQYPQPQPVPMQQPQPVPMGQPHPLPVQPHPVAPIPDSITTVATRVQTELNEILNKILEDTQRRYFAENSYHAGVNYDGVLAQLQDELRANITFHFDDQIKRAYGYSNYASKYSMEDIENLRRQIETNLITKLNRDFNRQREKYLRVHHVYMGRPMPANQVFYPAQQGHYNRDIAEMQRQLQEQLSRQLQTALMQQSYRQAHMYTNAGSGFNPQAHYQATFDQMTQELNRNLTRQMEMLNAEQYQSGAYGAQMAQMRNQLQHELMRQLQQGLQQSFSRYSSWSSSSSHSSSSNHNYRPVRGFDPNLYRVHGAGGAGEDCMMGDDPTVYQQQDDDGLTQQTENVDQDLTQQVQTHDDLTQQLQSDDLTQQVQDHDDLTQQVQSHDDLTQQVQTHDDLTQQLQSDDLTQQVQDHDDLTQQVQSHDDLTQQVQDHDDLTQQVQSHDDLTQHVQTHDDLTQQVQSDDLTQQVQDHDDLTQQVQSHDDLTQHVQDHDDLTQHVQDHDDFTQQVQSHDDLTQQVQSDDLTQQVQSHDDLTQQVQSHDYLTQQVQSNDMTQQNHDEFAPLTLGPRPVPQTQSQYHQGQIYQPAENLRAPTQYQQLQTPVDLTQQVQSQQQLDSYQPIPSSRPSQIPSYPITQQAQEPVDEPPYRAQRVNPIYSQFPRQEVQRPVPVRYQVYRTQPQVVEPIYQPQQTYTQANINPYRYRQQPNRYEPPQYTSVYQWQPQQQSIPRDTVGQRVQYYENLGRQTPSYRQRPSVLHPTPKPYLQINNQRQEPFGQQSETDDLSQQIQEPGQRQTSDFIGQTLEGRQIQDLTQQQSRDLTQQTEDVEYAPIEISSNAEKENIGYSRYPSYPGKPGQLADQQSLDNNPRRLIEQQAQVFTNQQNQDLTQQSQDLTQQTQDLTQQSQDLTQQSQDLTQQNQDLTQQTEDLSQQYQDLTHQNQYQNQPSQDLTQQTEDLTQQNQDLTQQIQQNQDQQNEGQTPSPYYIEQTQDVSHDLTQQIEDIDQPIEPQVSSNKIFPVEPSEQLQQHPDLTQQQQSQSLVQQEHNQNFDQQQQSPDLTQQQQNPQFDEEASTISGLLQQQNEDQSPVQTGNQRLNDAQRESQRLIDLLRNEQQRQYQQQPYSPRPVYHNYNGHPVQVGTTRQVQQNEQVPEDAQDTQRQEPLQPMQYHPRPVYADVDGHEQQVGTTRQVPGARTLTQQKPNQVNYGTTVAEPGNIETTADIEPIEPQVASEVQQVDDSKVSELEEPEGTTKPPGFWSRWGKKIKNKIG